MGQVQVPALYTGCCGQSPHDGDPGSARHTRHSAFDSTIYTTDHSHGVRVYELPLRTPRTVEEDELKDRIRSIAERSTASWDAMAEREGVEVKEFKNEDDSMTSLGSPRSSRPLVFACLSLATRDAIVRPQAACIACEPEEGCTNLPQYEEGVPRHATMETLSYAPTQYEEYGATLDSARAHTRYRPERMNQIRSTSLMNSHPNYYIVDTGDQMSL